MNIGEAASASGVSAKTIRWRRIRSAVSSREWPLDSDYCWEDREAQKLPRYTDVELRWKFWISVTNG
jgi:hypothetical protein